MKKIKRLNVFETNSSATHSLCISKDGMEPSNLPVDEDGYIITDFGDFGEYDMGITTYDQATKLSYIATECYYTNGWNEHIEENWEWSDVCGAVCKYTGAKGVRLLHKTEPSLNHQVIDNSLKFCDAWNYDSVINFIFNKYVGIKMGHD